MGAAPARRCHADHVIGPSHECGGHAARTGRAEQTRAEADRTISLPSACGEVIESEQVPPSGFATALRRCYGSAVQRANAVIVLDGHTITRTSFLELVREFNQSAARTARLKSP